MVLLAALYRATDCFHALSLQLASGYRFRLESLLKTLPFAASLPSYIRSVLLAARPPPPSALVPDAFPSQKSQLGGFYLPDLVSNCHFPLEYNHHGDEADVGTNRWLDEFCTELSPEKKAKMHAIQSGILAGFTYTSCSPHRLRAISDLLAFLFHLDNISDGMLKNETDKLGDTVMNALWHPNEYRPTKNQPEQEISAGRLARDLWLRVTKEAGPGVQSRFLEHFNGFFNAVHIEALDREEGMLPDLESYLDIRRDESGCKPCYDLIEYALGFDLPEHVIEHPIVKALNQGSNDLVSWSNDLLSYNVEQARGDSRNMISILQKRYGMDLQEAVDYVGELCVRSIRNFEKNKEALPSFGCPKLDRDVAGYVQGLQDWMVGGLHWSFLSHRYFGRDGEEVKRTRFVKLRPLKV